MRKQKPRESKDRGVTQKSEDSKDRQRWKIHLQDLPSSSEDLKQMLVETMRAMLVNSKLPQRFCAETVSTAAYLRNRSPTSAVEGMALHQAWYGCKPACGVNHLRVFGCTVFSHIPKNERRSLDSKTKKCTLLECGSMQKGCRVFDRLTWMVLYSRNVKFDEQELERLLAEEEESAW